MVVDRSRRSVASPSHRFGRTTTVVLAVTGLTFAGAGGTAADPANFDVVVGVPARVNDGFQMPGQIDVRLNVGGRQLLTEDLLGIGVRDDDSIARFGAALLTSDLNSDGFDELIVGVPGTPGLVMPGVNPKHTPGYVDIFFGSPTGITAAGGFRLPTHAEADDEFGADLSISTRAWTGDSTPPVHELWVGAPGHDVGGDPDAGAIFRYLVDATGTATYLETVTQDSLLVPGVAEAGDRFGEVLVGYSSNGTSVGVPHEDIGSAEDAGTVQRLRTDASTDALITAVDGNQNSAGVPGVAEAGDRFGAAIGGSAVGVPGEDIGPLKDAGQVQLLSYAGPDAHALEPGKGYNQNTSGIPGTAEAGDRFGAAVSSGVFQCNEKISAAIGAPGEDIGTLKDAGSVTMFLTEPADKFTPCPAKAFSQGHGLPGKAEAGDQVGAALGRRVGDVNDEETLRDVVMIGVPGEDVGSVPDAGRAVVGSQVFGHPNGDIAGLRYGSVFPS